MHHNSPKTFFPWTLKETLYFRFRNYGMPLYPHFENIFQKTIYGLHTNHSKRQTTIYHNFFFHHTLIQSHTHQNKNYKTFSIILWVQLVKDTTTHLSKAPKQMSKLSLTWTLTTDLIFLLLLYFPRVLNLEDLDPKLKILWFNFTLSKGNPDFNYTLDIFKQEDKSFCLIMKQ